MNDPTQFPVSPEPGPAAAETHPPEAAPEIAPETAAAPADAAVPEGVDERQSQVIGMVSQVYDPEIPVNIFELGLIYDIDVKPDGLVAIEMTLTSPACPSAQQIPSEVRYKVKSIPGVTEAWVDIVWEPPWDKDRMSEAAKLSLGMF